jgi:dTDP-4-amino-4,6-dideoxygalactose transaminase
MSELSAAMGLTSVESVEEFTKINRANLEAYQRDLGSMPGLSFVRYEEKDSPNYQYLALEIDSQAFGLTRDQLMSVLNAENIIARRYFYPGVHQMEPYRSNAPAARGRLHNTEKLAERILHLPTGTGVTFEDIEKICKIIHSAVAQGSQIKKAVKTRS